MHSVGLQLIELNYARPTASIEELQEKTRDRARDAQTFRNAVQAGEAGVPKRQEGGSSASSSGPAQKTLTIAKTIKLDLNKAKKYKPDRAVLHHCPYSQRIRGFCEWLPSRDSHGCSLAYGQDVACRVVLSWLWLMWSCFQPWQAHPL